MNKLSKNNSRNKVSRKNAVIIRIIGTYSRMILFFIQGIILVPLYLKYIDVKLYGAWLASGSIIALLGILDFGFFSVFTQQVAKDYGNNNLKILGNVIFTGIIIGAILSLIPFAVCIITVKWIPLILNINDNVYYSNEIQKAFLVSGISTSIMLLLYTITGILHGMLREGFLAIFNIVGWILGIGVTVILIINQKGLIAIPTGRLLQSVFSLVGNMVYLIFLLLKSKLIQYFRFNKANFTKMFRKSLFVFLSNLVKQVGNQSDALILAVIVDPERTTVFVITSKAATLLRMLCTRLPGAFMPSIASLVGESNMARAKYIVLKLIKFILLISLSGLGGVFILNKAFIHLWVGNNLFGGQLLTLLICMFSFIAIYNHTVYNSLFGIGSIKFIAKAQIWENTIRILLAITLCYFLNAKGLMLAGIIAMLSTSSWMMTNKLAQSINLNLVESLKKVIIWFIKMVIPIIIMATIVIFWEPDSVLSFSLLLVIYLLSTLFYFSFIDNDVNKFVKVILFRLSKYFIRIFRLKQIKT